MSATPGPIEGFVRVVRKLNFGYLEPVKQWVGAVVLGAVVFVGFSGLAQNSAVTQPGHFVADRSHLPAALQQVLLNRLSSGALMLLDRDGDLVRPASARQGGIATPQTAAESGVAALDSRVGPNLRLGDDPPALPNGMKAQAEPDIVRAPGNSNFLVGTFQEGRFTDGGAVDC